jgi:serine/threonine-protein kinase
MPPDAERFIPGRVLAGRYRVVERVGQGGMGEVYRAVDLKLGQPVALKFLPQELSEDPARLTALLEEVRLARQVSHPFVCRVHDIEEMDGLHFLSMEFVDGEDLASLLRRIGRLPADKANEIAREIATGLAAIHERGLLHRDLKPANIMIDGRGNARITDFGLAQRETEESDPEFIIGTPAYMAPECLAGSQTATVQSDLYSLGLVLYELFTGKHAFEGENLKEIIRRRRETTPIAPSQLQRDIDPSAERSILRCLEREPARRPRSAATVAASLPGGDPLVAAIAAGRTPSPELIAARTAADAGVRPAVAWACLGALVAGLAVLAAVAPQTRLLAALPLPEPPDAMAGRARELLDGLGFPETSTDRAHGFDFDESVIDRVVENDRSVARWQRLAGLRPAAVTYWYRQSPLEMVGAAPWHRVTYADPPWLAGMAGVKLDSRGFLERLDAPPAPSSAATAPPVLDVDALLRAAGLERADFDEAPPVGSPRGAGEQRVAYAGRDRENPAVPLQLDLIAHRGRPTAFEVQQEGAASSREPSDPSRRTTSLVLHTVRPALFLAALLFGAWLARRNLRAGRGDTKRALRWATALLAIRVLTWLLGAHLTAGSITTQLMTTVAWGLYDFAYGWVFYIAIEPYVRRLWPHLLISWTRFVDGRLTDARVGRDLLIGCLVGTVIALAVAAHPAAPALAGLPPGRPDNAGYVENQLASLLGLRHQLAELLGLVRSNVILMMGFVVMLVMSRLMLRHPFAAIAAVALMFVPLALPKGEVFSLNLGFAVIITALLLSVMFRFGLLAGATALITHAALEAAPLGMALGSWPTSRALLVLILVLGVGFYGFTRSLGGRSAIRDVLAP